MTDNPQVVKVQDTQMRCRSLLFEAVRQDTAGTVAPGVRANSLHVRNRSLLRRGGFPRLHVVVRVPTGVAVGVAAAPRNVNLQSALALADVSAPSYHLHWNVVVVVLLRMHAHSDLARLRTRLAVDPELPIAPRAASVVACPHAQVRAPRQTEVRTARLFVEFKQPVTGPAL